MAVANWTDSQVSSQLNSGWLWSGMTLTYAFPTSAAGINVENGEGPGFVAASPSQQVFFRLALQTWDDLIAPDFFETFSTSSDVEMAYTTSVPQYAWGWYPDVGSVWLNPGYSELANPVIGDYGFNTIVHELGHALGLNHMGAYPENGLTQPSSYQDSNVLSVMSYFGPMPADGYISSEVMQADWVGADEVLYTTQTPMLNDVMVIQQMYGVSSTTRTGDTTYGFSCNITGSTANIYDFSLNSHPILTIFDSAGIDTINLSGWSTDSILHLESGVYSSANSMTNNLVIAYSAVIENGVCGSGNDSLTGNSYGNMLDGGAGNDAIYGLAGDDSLLSARGDDQYYGGDGNDTAYFTDIWSEYSISYNASIDAFNIYNATYGADSYYGVEYFQFFDGVRTADQLIHGGMMAPEWVDSAPADNATGVAVDSNLVLTFNEAIKSGTGDIRIYNSDGTLARSIAATDITQVSFSGNTLTINPYANLANGGHYYVNIASGAVRDLFGNPFAGINDSATLNFVTANATTANSPPAFTTGNHVPANGKLTTDIGFIDLGSSVALQSDGKIIVAGHSWNNESYDDFALARYNSDGSLDSSFDGDGKLTTDFGTGNDAGHAVITQADGKFVVVGHIYGSDFDIAVARYNNDGSLDNSFDGDGKLTTGFGTSHDTGNAVIMQADGKIIVAGQSRDYSSNDDFALVRYNSDGSLDTSFDGDGKLTTDFGTHDNGSADIITQADGKIVVVGYAYNGSNQDVALARYNGDGSLDTSFSGDGKLTTDFGHGNDSALSVALQADHKILVAGFASNGSYNDFALARYNPDGSLDTSFSGDGKLTTDFAGYDDTVYGVTLQADGKILVAGNTYNGSSDDFALARYNSDGSLDSSFDGDGKLTTDFTGGADSGYSITLQADNKIVVAGISDQNFALARYNADGSLDTTFNSANTLNGAPAYTESGAAVVLDSSVSINDPELAAYDSYSGASVTLARHGGANGQDAFGARGNLNFIGGNAVLSGTIIGTVSNSTGTLTITFNGNANQARVNEALSAITYANHSDTPPASVQIDWTLNDGNSGAQGTGGVLSTTGFTTVAITAVNDPGNVNISGIVAQGQTLSAIASDAEGIAGAIDYQWQANGTNINGATSSSYIPTQNEVGKTLAVLASYTDGGGIHELASSNATYAVLANLNGPATSGNDRLFAAAGNNQLDGLGGMDTAVFGGPLNHYTITRTISGYTIHDNTGADGTDTLTNIERAQFTDRYVNLTVQATAATIAGSDLRTLEELYVAFFNRVPDADGLEFWIGQFQSGRSINQISEDFYFAGTQYPSLTGFSPTMSHQDFVHVVYRNVLGRTDGGDAEGVSYWTDELATGRKTHGDLVTTMLSSAHTFKGNPTWGWVADLLDNKFEIANTFALGHGMNYNAAADSISRGMDIAAAVTPMDISEAIKLIGVTDGWQLI